MLGRSRPAETIFLGSRGRAALLKRASAAESTSMRESCGLLLGRRQAERRDVLLITRCRNVAPQSAHSHGSPGVVELDPGHLVRAAGLAESRGLTVLGTWHTHPGTAGARSLSLADLGLLWDGAVALVVAPSGPCPGLSAWTLQAGLICPLNEIIEKRKRAA